MKKIAGTEVTIFIYDAQGKLAAEYANQISQSQQVSYLTTDHLSSPRISTDQNGAVTARHDYQPFGEEIARASYGADNVRKQFTGYERDSETDLDFAQARYFNSGFGRFSSPDDFLNDTHASNPQSWNLYSYVRNNPLKMIDPSGGKGEIFVTYDKETNTTTIKIRASFAVYGAKGQNVSQKDSNEYAALIKSSIEDKFKKEANVNGRNFVMSADITAQVVGNEEEAVAAGVDNIAELGYQNLDGGAGDGNALAVAFHVQGESFDRMAAEIKPGAGTGFEGLYKFANNFAHEFGAHLLNGGHSGDSKSFFYGYEGGTEFLEEDFTRLFREKTASRLGSSACFPNCAPAAFYSPFSRALTSTSDSYEVRGANRTYSDPSKSYRWIQEVKK